MVISCKGKRMTTEYLDYEEFTVAIRTLNPKQEANGISRCNHHFDNDRSRPNCITLTYIDASNLAKNILYCTNCRDILDKERERFHRHFAHQYKVKKLELLREHNQKLDTVVLALKALVRERDISESLKEMMKPT